MASPIIHITEPRIKSKRVFTVIEDLKTNPGYLAAVEAGYRLERLEMTPEGHGKSTLRVSMVMSRYGKR